MRGQRWGNMNPPLRPHVGTAVGEHEPSAPRVGTAVETRAQPRGRHSLAAAQPELLCWPESAAAVERALLTQCLLLSSLIKIIKELKQPLSCALPVGMSSHAELLLPVPLALKAGDNNTVGTPFSAGV